MVSGGILMIIDPILEGSDSLLLLSRCILFAIYVTQNGFVQLLYTQQWAFLGSVEPSKGKGSAWFAPVAGIGSVASTLAASGISKLARVLTLPGILLVAAALLFICAYCSEVAYSIAKEVRFPQLYTNPLTLCVCV